MIHDMPVSLPQNQQKCARLLQERVRISAKIACFGVVPQT